MDVSPRRAISILRNVGRLLRYGARSGLQNGPNTSSRAYFDLNDPRLERNLYWPVKMFDRSGYGVAMRFRPWLLLNLRNCSDYIYDIRDLRFVLKRPKDAVLEITERPGVDGGIYLDTNYFGGSRSERSFSLPFFMHPDVYHTGLDRRLHELTAEKRRVRVFLGGNLSDAYDTSAMKRFGVMNRSEVTRAALEALSSEQMIEISQEADAETILEGSQTYTAATMPAAVLPLKKWMQILGVSDFFVAPPGIVMPFSHNIIEAMAVGTIPITQYGHLFDPPLVDGETCLAFSGKDSLKARIEQAVSMAEEEIAELRQNVVEYYDTHLDPEAVVRKIVDRRDTIDRIYVIAGPLSIGNARLGLDLSLRTPESLES